MPKGESGMIIVMQKGATAREIANVTARVEQLGRQVHLSEGEERAIIGVVGDGRPLDREQIGRMSGVEEIVPRRRAIGVPERIRGREARCGKRIGGRIETSKRKRGRQRGLAAFQEPPHESGQILGVHPPAVVHVRGVCVRKDGKRLAAALKSPGERHEVRDAHNAVLIDVTPNERTPGAEKTR